MMVEMKKSVFAKYFTICIAFILVSITFLGAMLMLFASQYFKDEKYRTLLDGAQKAAAVTYSEYEAGEGTVSLTTLRPFYQLLAARLRLSVFFDRQHRKNAVLFRGKLV